MPALLVRGARVGGGEARDLGVDAGVFVDPGRLPADAEVVDLGGALVLPPLVEPHIHLDAVLTEGRPRSNASGSLFEGIAIWGERVRDLTVEDVKDRARRVLLWQMAHGVQAVRSHVDVCDPHLTAVQGLLELREELGDRLDLQLVAFPQQGILSFERGEELMRRAVNLGIDVVGAIPHFEISREYGERSVHFAMELAAEHGLRVDIHCDETDDEASRFAEVMAADTIRLGMEGRVTASHCTAMHSYGGAYAHRLVRNLHRAGMSVVTNPLDNSVLQGRFDHGPVRRGHARVKELLEAGVNVCIGHDSVMDPWYPLGTGDPVHAAYVLAHYGQMSGASEIAQLAEMITVNPARALGLPEPAFEPGRPASFVAFAAPTWFDALRLLAPRRLVVRAGRVVARTEPARTFVDWDGEVEVDFLR